MERQLSQHEALEMHELLVFKSVCMTKAYTMSTLAKDQDLKTILEDYTKIGQRELKQLESFFTGGNQPNE